MFKIILVLSFVAIAASKIKCGDPNSFANSDYNMLCNCLQLVASENRTCQDIAKFANCVDTDASHTTNPLYTIVDLALKHDCNLNDIFEFGILPSKGSLLTSYFELMTLLLFLTLEICPQKHP